MSQTQRMMTVMFADVAGSAKLYERLGDIEAAYAVDRCLKRITRCIEAGHGRTVQINGDELLAIFESAEEACLAAIDMQLRIADLPPVSGLQLTIRIGLHQGMIFASPEHASGMPVISAARIAGLATRDQILISDSLRPHLSAALLAELRPQPGLLPISEGENRFPLFQLNWQKPLAPEAVPEHTAEHRLSVTYRGALFIVDKHAPSLSLGRDPDSQLLIEDRKASRKHARIVLRETGFHYIDSSTNGSFVSLGDKAETLLRLDEIRLEGQGRICFATSRNDPHSDFMTFSVT